MGKDVPVKTLRFLSSCFISLSTRRAEQSQQAPVGLAGGKTAVGVFLNLSQQVGLAFSVYLFLGRCG